MRAAACSAHLLSHALPLLLLLQWQRLRRPPLCCFCWWCCQLALRRMCHPELLTGAACCHMPHVRRPPHGAAARPLLCRLPLGQRARQHRRRRGAGGHRWLLHRWRRPLLLLLHRDCAAPAGGCTACCRAGCGLRADGHVSGGIVKLCCLGCRHGNLVECPVWLQCSKGLLHLRVPPCQRLC